jgi:hypothetical protein
VVGARGNGRFVALVARVGVFQRVAAKNVLPSFCW